MASRPVLLPPPGWLFAPTSLRRRAGLLLMLITAGSLAMAAVPLTAAAHDDADSQFMHHPPAGR